MCIKLDGIADGLMKGNYTPASLSRALKELDFDISPEGIIKWITVGRVNKSGVLTTLTAEKGPGKQVVGAR